MKNISLNLNDEKTDVLDNLRKEIYQKGIILNKHSIDNQAVTHYFNFIFKSYQYRRSFVVE